jgi:membrane-associated phospholipid phosphatase/tRNA A-37 threonylcarbamoyl transferase component Bud32
MDAVDKEPSVVSEAGPTVPGVRAHRRPSGEPPPLPHELGRTGKFWIAMVAYYFVTFLGVVLFRPLARVFEATDAAILRWFADARMPWLTVILQDLNLTTSRWTLRFLRWGTILVLIGFRRWRHLFVFLGAIIALEILAYQFSGIIARPRPFDVEILAGWNGYSMPSRPLASLAVSLVGATYALIPQGVWRNRAKWATAAICGVTILARVYLGVDALSSAVFGAVLGVAVGLTAFRWFVPNDIFPVTYSRGKAAHLDVGGRRGEAIVKAAKEELDLTVLDARPVGLEGSGGSTPLLLRVAAGDGSERKMFAKLYAKSHVRADRWYKLGRTILYGALEDETPFGTVRRFVEYEDYALRLMADYHLPTPEPGGIVEITPDREYMIVMEFFDGGVELSEAEVDDVVIDDGLKLIRNLWDVGLAHRDVKPANLMVQDGHLRLIDVFFVQVRPSPWRQAVDLANMMLALGLRSDANRVYERALEYFTPEEIGEAFAATRGVASPTQLRSMLKEDGRNLLEEFRALAPSFPPIRIQRWSIRRVMLTATVALIGLIAISLIASNWTAFA